jgi:hypothetical protein
MGKINWKSQEEIDAEKNAPKPPTNEERLLAAEQAILAIMEAKDDV